MPEERKVPVKRVSQCGSCHRWYRKLRMYHVHFEGIERTNTVMGVTEKHIDENRLVCPKCYSDMGYSTVYVNQSEDDVAIIGVDMGEGDSYSVQRELLLTDKGSFQTTTEPVRYDYPKTNSAEAKDGY